jgi:hypothetical protein
VTSEQAIRQWLREVWDRDFSEGGKLVELLPGADNAARAAKLLRQMEEEGWIVRSRTPQPTPSQRAFLGLTYRRGIPPEHAEAYGWMPNRDSPGLREALGLTEAMRGLPYAELQEIWREEASAKRAPARLKTWPRPGGPAIPDGPASFATGPRDSDGLGREAFWDASPAQRRELLPEVLRNTDSSREDVARFARAWLAELDRVRSYGGDPLGAQVAAAAVPKPAPKRKARTYAEAQRDFLSYLRQQGWAVSPPLKEPHATSPDGGYRIWFRPQAVYYAPREAGKYDRGRARSLWFLRDLRQMDGQEFVAEIEESHEIRSRMEER